MKTGDIINCAASGGIKPITPGGGGPGSGSGGRTYYVGIYEGEIGCENTDQKREWVGLTPLEKRNMFKDIDWDTEDWGYLAYASQIEARLKELNGYT
jgi:hypothetical protein